MHVRRALALAVVAPLLLAGCSDDPEPTPKIPETSTSTPTDDPTDTETPEVESAEDFIRRWQAAADQMVVSGQAAEFLKMSKGCQACATYAKQVTEVYADGGSVDFAGSEVVAVDEDEVAPPTFLVEVKAARLLIAVPGKPDRTFPAATQRYRMILKSQPSGFVMRNYSVV